MKKLYTSRDREHSKLADSCDGLLSYKFVFRLSTERERMALVFKVTARAIMDEASETKKAFQNENRCFHLECQ